MFVHKIFELGLGANGLADFDENLAGYTFLGCSQVVKKRKAKTSTIDIICQTLRLPVNFCLKRRQWRALTVLCVYAHVFLIFIAIQKYSFVLSLCRTKVTTNQLFYNVFDLRLSFLRSSPLHYSVKSATR